ncbi:hypothetical protein [Geodermatophilus nigrescens]|uniref:hypothetical protein n=1 Tax=Geodermatophilus nigrescens TaxID=1070870 RepID=UPI001C31C34F|nr:hypothetical protein [Geodermatophilus nigrescens]
MRDEALLGDVVLVDAQPVGRDGERAGALAGREPLQVRDADLDDDVPARPRWRAALAKQATCSSWLVRFITVLTTR